MITLVKRRAITADLTSLIYVSNGITLLGYVFCTRCHNGRWNVTVKSFPEYYINYSTHDMPQGTLDPKHMREFLETLEKNRYYLYQIGKC